MENKTMLAAVAVLILVGVGFVVFQGMKSTPSMEESMETSESLDSMELESMAPTATDGAMMEDSGAAMMEEGVKTFTVTGTNFAFDVKEMRVNQGDTVKIVFKNGDGTHDWVIDEFNARTKMTQTGEEDTIEFVADQAGTFEYYCSVGQHRQMGMVGNLIVE
ncbi:hypothetical protein C4579_03590 [Candidatus Microgenomates bacterium]|nr:MAG: hypothetical protein C4579_03590 [Candidatus Microgenomates bacterium]